MYLGMRNEEVPGSQELAEVPASGDDGDGICDHSEHHPESPPSPKARGRHDVRPVLFGTNLRSLRRGPIARKAATEGESTCTMVCQVTPALLIASGGLVLSGLVLNHVQHWNVFREVSGLFILVPVLLGLKGNLDMTLASRLSTAAHSGVLQDNRKAFSLACASLALVQVQALLVGFVSAMLAVLLTLAMGEASAVHTAVIVTSALITSSVSALVLGAFTCILVVCSTRFKINPDNLATPLVSSLGDLATLSMLATTASVLHPLAKAGRVGAVAALCLPLGMLVPLCWRWASQHADSRPVLVSGWPPIVGAMLIGNISGVFLQQSVQMFSSLALLVPVINGVGGNLGSIYGSRLCSAIHNGLEENDWGTTSALMFVNVLLQACFLKLMEELQVPDLSLGASVCAVYLLAAAMQVTALFLFVRWVVDYVHSKGRDPDNYATPLLTALGDVLGTLFLVLGFMLVKGSSDLEGVPLRKGLVFQERSIPPLWAPN